MTVVVLTPEQLEDLVERAIGRALARGGGPAVLTTAQAAEVAGRSEKTVRGWVTSGALKASRRGRTIAIRREDLDRFLAGTAPDGGALVASLTGGG
jgi:excisionase family DNA binding protein